MATITQINLTLNDSGSGVSLIADVVVQVGSQQLKAKFTDAEMPLTQAQRDNVQATMDAIRTYTTNFVKQAVIIP